MAYNLKTTGQILTRFYLSNWVTKDVLYCKALLNRLAEGLPQRKCNI